MAADERRFAAPSGDDSSQRMQALGKRLVTILYRNLKLTQIFDRQNRAVIQPVQELLAVAADLSGNGRDGSILREWRR